MLSFATGKKRSSPKGRRPLRQLSLAATRQDAQTVWAFARDISPTVRPPCLSGAKPAPAEETCRRRFTVTRRASGPLSSSTPVPCPKNRSRSVVWPRQGAFTGANLRSPKTRVCRAHGGTIFLDEIGELVLELQPSLLRALDKRAVRPSAAVPIAVSMSASSLQPTDRSARRSRPQAFRKTCFPALP